MDKDSGLVHHVEVTSANVHDVEMTPKLMTGDESELYGDSGYIGAEKRQDAIIRNRQGKSRARICGHKGAASVSKNAIPGSAKTDRQTEYAVRAGELGSG